MATHILTRPDKKTYYLNLTEAEAGLVLDKIEKGETVRAKGEIFSGRGCSLDRSGGDRDVNQSSRLMLDAEETFRLGTAASEGFWAQILRINAARRKEGRQWIFPTMAAHARDESGISVPSVLFEFIDAEWENIEPEKYNRPDPPQDHQSRRMAKEYLATEPGRAYAMSHPDNARR